MGREAARERLCAGQLVGAIASVQWQGAARSVRREHHALASVSSRRPDSASRPRAAAPLAWHSGHDAPPENGCPITASRPRSENARPSNNETIPPSRESDPRLDIQAQRSPHPPARAKPPIVDLGRCRLARPPVDRRTAATEERRIPLCPERANGRARVADPGQATDVIRQRTLAVPTMNPPATAMARGEANGPSPAQLKRPRPGPRPHPSPARPSPVARRWSLSCRACAPRAPAEPAPSQSRRARQAVSPSAAVLA